MSFTFALASPRDLRNGGSRTRMATDPKTADNLDFAGLVDRHYHGLYQFAYSLTRSEAEASDLTQQTFYIWATKGHQLRDAAKVKTWLFTTLHREFLKTRRRQTRFPHCEVSPSGDELPPISPTMVNEMDGAQVLQALAQVEEPYQAPLALFYLENYSYKEIAEILAVPIGTVQSRLARGKAQLQQIVLGGPVPDLNAEALAQARRDPELARWLLQQQAVDAALRQKFSQVPVPARLQERILANHKVVKPPASTWGARQIGLAVAAAVVAALAVWMTTRQPANFDTYRRQMASWVAGNYKMMLESKDQGAVRQFLASHHGLADYELTPALEKLPTEGCALVDWHGQKASLVCFDLGHDADLFLFVIDVTAIPDPPTGICQQFSTDGPLASVSWTRGNKTYTLALKGTEQQLRQYL
jgi:RNA polymerase sigma-70 factor (ECF subfamily)